MDKEAFSTRLVEGASALGIGVDGEVPAKLAWLAEELVRWNRKVNLTAITDPLEVLEKHLLDSLVLLRWIPAEASVLDVGTGPGFPGLPLKIARPTLTMTLVDSVHKKVAFSKHAIARLHLRRISALHARAEGQPTAEGLPLVDVAVSRAVTEFGEWVRLGAQYLLPGGSVLAMLGATRMLSSLEESAAVHGLRLEALHSYALPWSGAERAVAVVRREGGPTTQR